MRKPLLSLFTGILTILSLPSISQAAPSSSDQLRSFATSLEKEVFVSASRSLSVARRIKVKKPGLFRRIGNSEAIYIPSSNTIVLKKELFIGNRVRNLDELGGSGTRSYSYQTKAGTVFHELSHAEMDVLVSYNNNYDFNNFMNRTVKNWMKKNYRVNAGIAAQELYGYTAEKILQLLFDEVNRVLLDHGMFQTTKGCMSEGARRNIATRLNLQEELSFKINPTRLKDYKTVAIAKKFYVDAKEFVLKPSFSDAWKDRIFNHFKSRFNIPATTEELIARMNKSSYYKNMLSRCYKSMLQSSL